MPPVPRYTVAYITTSGEYLEAEATESFRLRAVRVHDPGTAEWLDLRAHNPVVQRYPLTGYAGNTLPYAPYYTTGYESSLDVNLMHWLRRHGIDISIPIPAEHRLYVEWDGTLGGHVLLELEKYDAGEVRPDEPNGPDSKIRRTILWGTNTVAVTDTADTYVSIDHPRAPAGGITWPYDGDGVPSGMEIRLLGAVGSPVSFSDGGTPAGYTHRLQLYHRGSALFDEARAGLPFSGAGGNTSGTSIPSYDVSYTCIGPNTSDLCIPPLLFEEPLVFGAGEAVSVQVLCADESGSLKVPADAILVGLIAELVWS